MNAQTGRILWVGGRGLGLPVWSDRPQQHNHNGGDGEGPNKLDGAEQCSGPRSADISVLLHAHLDFAEPAVRTSVRTHVCFFAEDAPLEASEG